MKPIWFPEEKNCTSCSLYEKRTNVVPGVLGSLYDGVFIVGEAPGPDEDTRGTPWIGPAGQFLMELLDNAGLNREMFYMVQAAKCWPHASYVERGRVKYKTLAPKAKDAKTCFNLWFLKELNQFKPHTIVALGGTTLKLFMGSSAKIGEYHGRVFKKEIKGYGSVKIISLYHPAAKFHQPALEATVRGDFHALPGLLEEAPEQDKPNDANYLWIRRHESPEPFLQALKAPAVAIDTETYMRADYGGSILHASHAELLGISISSAPGHAAYIDSFHAQFPRVLAKVKLALLDPNRVQMLWNAAYDLEVLGVPDAKGIQDGMLMSFVLEEPRLKLEECVGSILHIRKQDLKDTLHSAEDLWLARATSVDRSRRAAGVTKKLTNPKRRHIRRVEGLPAHLRAQYAMEDADYCFQLTARQANRLTGDAWKVYAEIELPLIPHIMEMTRTGMGVNLEVLQRIGRNIGPALEEADNACRDAIGPTALEWLASRVGGRQGDFNPGSSSQLADILFEYLKIPPIKRSKQTGKPSADESVIAQLALSHPEIPLWAPLLKRRELIKIKGTYVEGIQNRVCRVCFRLHPSLKQHGARTGRMSSDLQQLPIQRSLGRQVKEALTV
jgi:uracil-DNA glycosylase family 4